MKRQNTLNILKVNKLIKKQTQDPQSVKSILEVKLDIEDKTHVHIHETITNMAILVHLKDNVKSN